jgi:hypothetical protein
VPLKFTAGLSKKLTAANRGSLAASCRIEIEIDESFSNDPDGIQRRVEQAYTACRRAVEDELGRQEKASGQPAAEQCFCQQSVQQSAPPATWSGGVPKAVRLLPAAGRPALLS